MYTNAFLVQYNLYRNAHEYPFCWHIYKCIYIHILYSNHGFFVQSGLRKTMMLSIELI